MADEQAAVRVRPAATKEERAAAVAAGLEESPEELREVARVLREEQGQAAPATAEPSPLSYGELKRREKGVYEFTLTSPADDQRGRVLYLRLHGGRFKMERGKSRVFKFALPAEARILSQLADEYAVEEGGPPIEPEALDPEPAVGAPVHELADAFANRDEIAPEPPPAKPRSKPKQQPESTEG